MSFYYKNIDKIVRKSMSQDMKVTEEMEMFDSLFSIFVIIFFIIFFKKFFQLYSMNNEKIDGVASIDGITYLIVNTDVEHVMYKLSSDCVSQVMKWTSFVKISDTEGSLMFGGIAYPLAGNSGFDLDMGVSYRIQCEQKHADVVMKISYEGKQFRWQYPFKGAPPYVANQAYHRFFKEQFNVKVIRDTDM